MNGFLIFENERLHKNKTKNSKFNNLKIVFMNSRSLNKNLVFWTENEVQFQRTTRFDSTTDVQRKF